MRAFSSGCKQYKNPSTETLPPWKRKISTFKFISIHVEEGKISRLIGDQVNTHNEEGSDGFIDPTILLQQITNYDASAKKSNK